MLHLKQVAVALFAIRQIIKPHVYSFDNLMMVDVEDSVGVRFETVTKHGTLI